MGERLARPATPAHDGRGVDVLLMGEVRAQVVNVADNPSSYSTRKISISFKERKKR